MNIPLDVLYLLSFKEFAEVFCSSEFLILVATQLANMYFTWICKWDENKLTMLMQNRSTSHLQVYSNTPADFDFKLER